MMDLKTTKMQQSIFNAHSEKEDISGIFTNKTTKTKI